MMTHQNAVSVFLSYTHKDEPLLRELETHLSSLKRQGLISTWYDRQIVPGTNWAKVIDERLEQASIILLLVSPDFLASDYCYQVEMKRALERHEAGKARVIPILMRPVDWKDAPFAHLQALPTDARAITTWHNRDEAFVDVTTGIRRAVENLPLPSASASHPALPTITKSPAAKWSISRRKVLIGLTLGVAVAVAGTSGLVLFHPSSPGKLLYRYNGHSAGIRALAWSPNGGRIATASDDYTAQVWDATTGQHAITYEGHHSSVEGVAWSPDGRHIASGGADGTVQIWNPDTGDHLSTYNGHEDAFRRNPSSQGHAWVNRIAWSPDGSRIASCDQFSASGHIATVQIWEAITGKTLVIYTHHTNGVFSVAWSPDGSRIASCGYDATLQVWEPITGKTIATYTASQSLLGLSWSPDNKRIVVGGRGPVVRVVNANTGNIIYDYTIRTTGSADVAWSPDGTSIAAGTDRETVDIFDAMTGKNFYSYAGQSGHIFAVGWSPDSTCIASGSENGTVHVWQAV